MRECKSVLKIKLVLLPFQVLFLSIYYFLFKQTIYWSFIVHRIVSQICGCRLKYVDAILSQKMLSHIERILL